MLGVTFQSDTRFDIHVRKEQTQNKSLYVLRTLIKREGFTVYGAAEVKLTTNSVVFFGQMYFKKRRYMNLNLI